MYLIYIVNSNVNVFQIYMTNLAQFVIFAQVNTESKTPKRIKKSKNRILDTVKGIFIV